MDNSAKNTREEWLREAAILIEKDILSKQLVSLPEQWTVSVGFPFGSAKAIGQAWDKESSEDKQTHQMFISPVLGNHDIVQMLQVLLHEMIHLAVGVDQKHGGMFKTVARNIGLEGRLTATYVSDNNPLYAQLQSIASAVGWQYPHKTIVKNVKAKKERKSNIVKLVSPQDSSYTVKMNKNLMESFGVPKDAWGNQMELAEGDN